VLNKESALAAAMDISHRMSSVRSVEKVEDPILSADGNAVMVAVIINENYKAKDQIQSLLEQTTTTQATYPSLKIMQTGDASISKGNDKELGKGLQRAEIITLPVTLIILFLVFGTILAAGVPLILALSSVAAPVPPLSSPALLS
jgi:putative drug exporter of the RND superfamily